MHPIPSCKWWLPANVLSLTRLWPCLIALCALTCASPAAAQQKHGSANAAAVAASAPAQFDSAVKALEQRESEAQTRYAEAYYKHLSQMNDIVEAKFKWQDRASSVTLWLVVFVVVSGVALTFFQLWIAFHHAPGAPAGADETCDTTIEASKTNFRVQSSVVGVIILIISCAFLYLFLKEVYDIKPVDMRNSLVPPSFHATIDPTLTADQFGLPLPPPVSPQPAPQPKNVVGAPQHSGSLASGKR